MPKQVSSTTVKNEHDIQGSDLPESKVHSHRQQMVTRRAYELWLERGCPEGSPEDDWYRAEQEFGAAAEPQTRAKKAAAKVERMRLGAGIQDI